ncbi:DUF1488 family protein [Pantoea latae]|jgi:hypothetical protein|uniref:DUF1488 domain-containing protein n=1 Tax=Pantoea latae TaxID=1964541 RepID=A0A1V9DQZ8_9GAMM|nr:DUF1488 domain-containing protein [Pantoea latae]OQP36281.1 hypothetical protein B2J69_00010 [Pantoea latae]
MNQAIQFPDREEWNAEKKAVCFPALANGMLLTCAISADALAQRFGQGEALALFVTHRWDIEEEAEAAILNEAFDDQEWVWLASAR